MADNNNFQGDANLQGDAPQAPQFALQRIYLKDLSFESPLGLEAFKQAWQPKIGQDLNTSVNKLDEDLYEVVLKVTVSATAENKTIFLVEVQQAGIFMVRQMEPPQMAHLFNSVCPQILFPYAREVIDSCVVKGSFPALALPPINFDALFLRAVQQAQAQAEKEAAKATTN
ncbi:protein-export chaperone SecB [Saccharophagus sp. K07]|jgi:preprotein translocase subunit SecB|uniref:protein-export chaperone SecB n=1 Tax=Saccharophagus sp. K07 TaxID=2283636 RepID=UPI0016525791|nr:protein-export chaperone SecB [Saccharophagus sp. K07]MBC6905876.1 protein-export chaperone SecB [Saccharophagus sp. K07]